MQEQEKNRIAVTIHGSTYYMVGTETVGHMRLIASMVDDRMKEIKRKNPSLDSTQLAVLTAVNMVNENVELKEYIEELEEQLRKLKD
ncbi:cell division protein ZapA [Lysinibacillus alkalisoli]|uniref:Cell division protein ZapA n=1 Tax=Lysinibacillus alkalisoli TaxID=1911548 RepID=A0A917G8L0_9BACI|nr:cell division protein ZapA [Lysinibacillus alkalisoli]GGG28157.1 cell division protein ZapA [Lysinibacillus alkalisoli]